VKKRWRKPKAKPGELKVAYGRGDHGDGPDIYYCHGASGADRCDARMISSYFDDIKGLDGKTMRQELEVRGYDITTMKFSIQQKQPPTTPSGEGRDDG
jgi:hypothetical protein